MLDINKYWDCLVEEKDKLNSCRKGVVSLILLTWFISSTIYSYRLDNTKSTIELQKEQLNACNQEKEKLEKITKSAESNNPPNTNNFPTMIHSSGRNLEINTVEVDGCNKGNVIDDSGVNNKYGSVKCGEQQKK